MAYSLVTESELCSVLNQLAPAGTGEIAAHLTVSYRGIYAHFRRFDDAYVEHEEPLQRDFKWWLTDTGRAVVDEADFPPIKAVDLEEYFAGRQTSLNPNTILHEIAIYEDEWTPTSILYDALPYGRSTIRRRLTNVYDDELVDRDTSQKTNHWRLTAAGREQLAEADDATPHDDTKRIFEEPTT